MDYSDLGVDNAQYGSDRRDKWGSAEHCSYYLLYYDIDMDDRYCVFLRLQRSFMILLLSI